MKLKGSVVFSSGRVGDYDIWSLDLESGTLSQLTQGENNNDHPRWSPDGSQILYVSASQGEPPQIWVMNRDGSDQRLLTRDYRYHAHPSWSPDGSQIVFCGNYDNREEIEVCVMKADGSGEPEVVAASPGLETEPNFSPDGKSIIFSSMKSGNSDIWKVSLKDRSWQQLTTHPGKDFCPCYSPNGQQIAFVCRPSLEEDGEVWIANADGSDARQLTNNKVSDHHVRWAPDGEHLIYCSSGSQPGTSRIRIISLQSESDSQLEVDRTALELEVGAQVTDYGIFSALTPDFIQRLMVRSDFWGQERNPDWR